MGSDNAGITTWSILIIASIYIVLANFSLISFVSYQQSLLNSNYPGINVNQSGNVDYNSSGVASSSSGGVSFFNALRITTTVILPWWITFFFIILPDAFIPVIIFMFTRGIW